MDKYIPAKSNREAKLEEFLAAYQKPAKILEDQWEKIQQDSADLKTKKEALTKQNGVQIDEVSNSDILDINAGGQIVRVTRGTLTQVEGSLLEALFSGRWEKQLHRDSKGRIFLDVNPNCFKNIVDYLNECKIAPPDNPPDLPKTDSENQVFLDGLLTAFGLIHNVDSTILTDSQHMGALRGFLEEANFGSQLTLLYRGTRDGMNASTFHQKCDDQGPTVTVVKSSGNYIFGGFSDRSWASNGGFVSSEKPFLFGLYCHGGNEPVKIANIRGGKHDTALYMASCCGPSFGGGHDLGIFRSGNQGSSLLGNTYSYPTASYFAGRRNFDLLEVEVFKVSKGRGAPPASQAQAQPWHRLTFDNLPKDLQKGFKAEKEALIEASNEHAHLQHAFENEMAAVQIFCSGDDDQIVLLNVSGNTMAVKHSTLAKYPESVLYKQFADPNWNGKRARKVSPREWSKTQVVAWSKKIPGLAEEVDHYFQCITGAELLVLGREDIKDLGIKHPGTVALVVDAIQNLRKEEEENSATFIEHSDYCFGKVINQMRLKALSPLGVPDPSPPEIREPDRKRFKRIVEYYFPTEELASQFLD